MSEYIIGTDRKFCRENSIDVEIRFEGAGEDTMVSWLGDELDLVPQGGGDLGERMNRAAEDAFREGAREVVLVGTDCPEMSRRVLEDAFRHLRSKTIAVGPAADGGYYLIGMTRPLPGLFEAVAWGTHRVLEQTIERARGLDLDVALLETLHDIDRPEDYPLWEGLRRRAGGSSIS